MHQAAAAAAVEVLAAEVPQAVVSEAVVAVAGKMFLDMKHGLLCSLFSLVVLMEINENIQEKVSSMAITEVISSMMLVSVLSVICNAVMTNRQNPKRFAEVFKMC